MKNEDYPFYDICHVDTIKDLILTNEEEFTDDKVDTDKFIILLLDKSNFLSFFFVF